MPALVVCGKRWLVGTDDFVVPALVAIIIRLICLGGTVGVIIYLFFGPPECLGENLQAENVPPLLYGSLFAFALILCMSILNEGIIFSVSIKGGILDISGKRKRVVLWLGIRSVLIIIEVLTSILCTIAVFGPGPYAAGALVCPEYHDGPLVFAKVIAVAMLATEVFYIVGFITIVDPCGLFCSPSVLPSLDGIDNIVNKSPAELKERDSEYAANSRLGRLHSNHVGYRDVLKKVKGALCCLSANGNRSRQTALKEMALALHTLFSNEDVVPSDIVAGLYLVSRKQKKEAKGCEAAHGDQAFRCPCRIKGLRKITFEHMPPNHLPQNFSITDLPPPVPFDPSLTKEQLLMEDLVHYMHYSMGIYGWMLHIFDKPLCGVCQLLSATCCRCKYRRWHPLARPDPELQHPRIIKDDCCMSGLATLRLRSKLGDQHIVYISYENDVFQAPFSICVDDKMETVVLTVRGTLSIKDAMTDLSVSMVKVEEKYRNPYVEGKQYMHKGMYITTKHIYDELSTKKLLDHAFLKNSNYRLIITGHSLGAGVASLLSIMLKPYYPDLYCYAFSPPGCIVSFPLAYYSQDFIQVVVLGNDMIPRITFRSLFYLKRQMEFLIRSCQYSKFQILFRPRFFDSLPFWTRNCLFSDKKDPIFDSEPLNEELKQRLSSGERITSFDGAVQNFLRAKRAGKKWKRLSRQVEGTIHGFVAGVEDGTMIASFPPRNVLHIPVKYSKMPWLFHHCFPDRLSMNHVNSEDICVITVDRGMVDDHLPNSVLAALLRCQKEIVGRQYRPRKVMSLRIEERQKISECIAQRKPLPTFSVDETSLSCASPNVHKGAGNSDDVFGFHSDSNALHSSKSHSNGAVMDQPLNISQATQEQDIQKRKWPKVSQNYVVEMEL